jgi:hypothetical protein
MVTLVSSLHNVKLIMYVPIKTANQQFTRYRIIGLPNQIHFPVFVIGKIQPDYALPTQIELQQCTTNNITDCPVSTAFYDIQTTTCPSNLYFRTAGENNPRKMTFF